ncbi:MAG: ribosome biogenesis GTPase YlqF [Leptolyngbyaceae cyanobacterium MO_188.B28]|nr:ribosome biogenesis GTPase YlqF [Leptolyngbyaceae cyanobacterium MO_188.B28]
MAPSIQWYPGHIAKAEKSLVEQLKRVDAVLEVRDARIPLATHHPRMGQWIGNKGRILVLNRVDMISSRVKEQWQSWFQGQEEIPYFTNAQKGQGVIAVAKAAQAVGEAMNQRRCDRGMRPRPVRLVVLGFPNVGKSALINRLLKRKVVASARRPGVTRQLRWVRISDQLELLDAPGVLPSQLTDQDAALKLAICDDIGQAAYDNQRVAAAFLDLLKTLDGNQREKTSSRVLSDRYRLNPQALTGESYLVQLAEQHHQGDIERMARRILTDFRKGDLGELALEFPPCLG